MKKLPILKKILKYLLLVVSTSLIFIIGIGSLPQTERVMKNNLDINISDNDYWQKEYVIKISFTSDDIVYKWRNINRTKDIIFNRLKKYGVDLVQMDYKDKTDLEGELKVIVKDNGDENDVRSLVAQKGEVYLVTRKSSVQFNDSSNPYAVYDVNNYDITDLNRSFFRTIYVTKLKATSGEMTYFGIFKPYIWNSSKFYSFINDHSGEEHGLYMDGFVSPITIPVSQTGSTSKPILAVGLSTDEGTAKLQNILFNTGTIPLDIEITGSNNIEVNSLQNNDIISIVIGISVIVVTMFFVYYISPKDTFNFLLTTSISISSILFYLKLVQFPIATVHLLITLLITILISFGYILTKNKLLIIIFGIFLSLISFIIFAGLQQISLLLLGITLLIPVMYFVIEKYLELFKNLMKR